MAYFFKILLVPKKMQNFYHMHKINRVMSLISKNFFINGEIQVANKISKVWIVFGHKFVTHRAKHHRPTKIYKNT